MNTSGLYQVNNNVKKSLERKTIKKIFIIDDNELYAKTLRSYLSLRFLEIQSIKIFRVGELGLLELNKEPDIIILDFILNTKYTNAGNGFDIITKIKRKKPKTNVILLSALEARSSSILSVKNYYSGYVYKNQDAFENIKSIIKDIYYGK